MTELEFEAAVLKFQEDYFNRWLNTDHTKDKLQPDPLIEIWENTCKPKKRKDSMKPLLSLAILALCLSTQAGTLKIPAQANISRNAGTSVPVSFTASGWPSSAKVKVFLVNAKTWIATQVNEVPLRNGANSLSIPIDWSFEDVGSYVVKLVSGSTQCTGTQLIKIKSAVVWPYGGTVWHPGQAAAVTWTPIPQFVDYYLEFFEVYLMADPVAGEPVEPFVIDFEADPRTGRLDFVVPSDVPPGNNYRIHLDGFASEPFWNDEFLSWDYWYVMEEQTQSERITIQ